MATFSIRTALRPGTTRESSRRIAAPLYPAHRIDWSLRHAVAAMSAVTLHGDADAEDRLQRIWATGDAVPFLSVRSALVALLESVRWPAGSEVLVSAVNIGDIPKIIRSFGHVVVPVDVDPLSLQCDPAELAAKTSERTRALIVAHLFGGVMNIEPLVEFARLNRLLLIEDCAQSYTTRAALAARKSDLRLFSFGLLKTGTVLGGAIAEVGDPELRHRMQEVQRSWRRQRRSQYAGKIAKSCLFLLVQRPVSYRVFAMLCRAAGSSSGAVLRRLTRGFGKLDGDALLRAFRCRPSLPLLSMLAWRVASEDGDRVTRRTNAGERLHHRLSAIVHEDLVAVGSAQGKRTHWLVPVSTSEPDALRQRLADAGFDAYGASNVVAIGGTRASEMIEGLVFLPCYPEMSGRTRDRVAAVVRDHSLECRYPRSLIEE